MPRSLGSDLPSSTEADEPGPPSFDAIFREHFAYVWRVARALVGDFLADDVTQEAFLVVRARLDTHDGRSLRAWLYGITRNVARNILRSQVRHDARARVAPAWAGAPPVGPHVQEAADLMQKFLARLPPPQREAFMLKELEELTAAEIAMAIGVPLQTVYSRVRAARVELERFRAELIAKERPR